MKSTDQNLNDVLKTDQIDLIDDPYVNDNFILKTIKMSRAEYDELKVKDPIALYITEDLNGKIEGFYNDKNINFNDFPEYTLAIEPIYVKKDGLKVVDHYVINIYKIYLAKDSSFTFPCNMEKVCTYGYDEYDEAIKYLERVSKVGGNQKALSDINDLLCEFINGELGINNVILGCLTIIYKNSGIIEFLDNIAYANNVFARDRILPEHFISLLKRHMSGYPDSRNIIGKYLKINDVIFSYDLHNPKYADHLITVDLKNPITRIYNILYDPKIDTK